MTHIITIVYIFIGLGVFGGFKAWGEAGKSLYILVFPLHAFCSDLQNWSDARCEGSGVG